MEGVMIHGKIVSRLSMVSVSLIAIAVLVSACAGGGSSSNEAAPTAQGPMSSVAVSWQAPQQYTDGSSLNPSTDLNSYNVYYGTASHSYTGVVNVANPGTVSNITENLNLASGTYYIAVTAVSKDNVESDYSNEVVKAI